MVLRDVSPPLSGRYRCEVSADAPSFHTAMKTSYMHVVGEFIPRHINLYAMSSKTFQNLFSREYSETIFSDAKFLQFAFVNQTFEMFTMSIFLCRTSGSSTYNLFRQNKSFNWRYFESQMHRTSGSSTGKFDMDSQWENCNTNTLKEYISINTNYN